MRITRIGVDAGSTLTKIMWQFDDGTYDCDSVSSVAAKRNIVESIMEKSMTNAACVIGIGSQEGLERLHLMKPAGDDPIVMEIRLQADGARRLLMASGAACPESFYIASIGTGTSYSAFRNGEFILYPYGRPIGGGMISGLSNLVLGNNHPPSYKSCDDHYDLDLSDLLQESDISPADPNIIVASFAKLPQLKALSKRTFVASLFRFVAYNVAQDVGMMKLSVPEIKSVVYIGTIVEQSLLLRNFLDEFSRLHGIEPVLPLHAGYAGALGALHAFD